MAWQSVRMRTSNLSILPPPLVGVLLGGVEEVMVETSGLVAFPSSSPSI